ncbi:hypothetical protein BHM03_00037634 [Ensete ventricosum]|nr:hypothetical protein BHM03_00037634 [Ensete ventricosum]
MDAQEFFVGARGICSRPEFVAMFQGELLILDRGTLFGLTSWAELHSLRVHPSAPQLALRSLTPAPRPWQGGKVLPRLDPSNDQIS